MADPYNNHQHLDPTEIRAMSDSSSLSQITRPRLLSVAIAGLLLMPGARAATLTVNSTADPGDETTCTLRRAIESVNAAANQGGCVANTSVNPYGTNDTILFAPTVIDTITLENGELQIQKDLVIDGPGAAQLAVDGDTKSRVFRIDTGTSVAPRNVTIDGLTIRNGAVAGDGGGILLGSFVSLALTNSTVSGNSASGIGGGVHADENNTLTLTNSTVSANSASGTGGGVHADENNTLTLTNSTVSANSASGTGGGVVAVFGNTLTLTNSTVSANSATPGGGGVFAVRDNTLMLTNSTVSGNSATDIGGGVFAEENNTLTLTNSTVSGNSATDIGGGVFASTSNTLTLTNSTVSGNSAALGGGVYVRLHNNLTQTNSILLTNSILANSTGGDCFAGTSTVTGTDNLIEDAVNACGLSSGENIIGEDPQLDQLDDNGCVTPSGVPGSPDYGCVRTHALLDGSPALNAANAAVCAADPVDAIDERGAARPQGGGCDIGAFERGWPGAPTQVTVSPGVERVTVSWTPPVDPGLGALRSCTATAEPGGASCTGLAVSNQCTLTGLTPGTTYTVSVVCTNDAGISGFTSATSEPVSPLPPSVPAVSAAGLLGSAGLLGLLGAWRLRRQARRRGR